MINNKTVKIFRVLSNYGHTEYSFHRNISQANVSIDSGVKNKLKSSLDSEEMIRNSFYIEETFETEEDAYYLLNM